MTDAAKPEPHLRASGFTLLEVLGAVAILGVSYIVLATTSIQGLKAIGGGQRRIEASLLADKAVAELEVAAETGQLVDPRRDEWESGPFEVKLDVFDMSFRYEGTGEPEDAEDLLEFLGNEANGEFAPHRKTNLLLGYLREVHVSVSWKDGVDELEVTRTAFIYDQQSWVENEAGEPDGAGADDDAEEDQDDLLDQDPDDVQQQIRDGTIGSDL